MEQAPCQTHVAVTNELKAIDRIKDSNRKTFFQRQEMLMKTVVLVGYTLNPGDLDREGIKKHGDLTVLDRVDHSPSAVIEAIGDAEVAYTNKTPLPAEGRRKVPNVKHVGGLATGYNVVDVECATECDIQVTNFNGSLCW